MESHYPPFGIGLLDCIIGIITCFWLSPFLLFGAVLAYTTYPNLVPGVLLLGFSRYVNGVGVQSIPSWLRYFHMIIGVVMIIIALVPVYLIYFYPSFFAVGWLNLALIAFSCDLFVSGMTFTGVSQTYDWFSFAIGITGLILASIVQLIPFSLVILEVGFFIAGIFTCITGVLVVLTNR